MGIPGLGIIGTGFWGRNHARVIHEMETAELVGVCDLDPSKAREIGEKYNVEWYTRDEDLIARNDIDAVCVCTPTVTHADIALKLIARGKHVLIEKPIAETVGQAQQIVDAAEREGVFTMTGFIERFNPGFRRLKEMVVREEIGTAVLAFARRVGSWPVRVGDVGVLKDAAIHDIDIARHLYDDDPAILFARAGSLRHTFEDFIQITMGFEGIKTAFVEANWLTPHKIRTLTVTGSDAIAILDYLTQEIVLEDKEKTLKVKHEWEEPLKNELEHFATCIHTKKAPAVTGFDGLRALQIAEAATQSAHTGKAIQLHWS
jgi:UDP-N-acetylglucosamine 3-dehydrogenase